MLFSFNQKSAYNDFKQNTLAVYHNISYLCTILQVIFFILNYKSIRQYDGENIIMAKRSEYYTIEGPV